MVINEDYIYDILEKVAATSSKNEKEEILMQHQDDELLKRCFELAYSPTIKFFNKKLPEITEFNPRILLSEALDRTYNYVAKRVITGQEATEYLISILGSLTEKESSIFRRVILQDLKIGCKDATINKVWKGLIVKPPRMGAASMNDKSLKKLYSIKNLAVELKSDGSYAASICGEQSTMMSRNGSPLDIECLQEHLSCGAFNGFALEGELVYSLDKATRESGNGIITKIVKGTASAEEKENAMYQIWDCIDNNYYQPKGEYLESNTRRREILESMMLEYEYWCREVANVEPKIHLIERKEKVSVEEAFEIFEQYVRDGYEGAIAKDMDATWKDVGKPAYNIKIKRKEPADLKVVGWYPAEVGSKYEGLLGGFYCESECGTVKVSVGSGFNDEERKQYTIEQPPIVEVEYDSITEDKRTGQNSLFLPIYKRPRYDKNIADSYQDILDKQRIK